MTLRTREFPSIRDATHFASALGDLAYPAVVCLEGRLIAEAVSQGSQDITVAVAADDVAAGTVVENLLADPKTVLVTYPETGIRIGQLALQANALATLVQFFAHPENRSEEITDLEQEALDLLKTATFTSMGTYRDRNVGGHPGQTDAFYVLYTLS